MVQRETPAPVYLLKQVGRDYHPAASLLPRPPGACADGDSTDTFLYSTDLDGFAARELQGCGRGAGEPATAALPAGPAAMNLASMLKVLRTKARK